MVKELSVLSNKSKKDYDSRKRVDWVNIKLNTGPIEQVIFN